jgi:hypothetical protein
MSVFGTRLMGRVDDVPGMFHVATKCWHINFVPFVPVQTYIVLSKNGRQFRGIKIPLSLKSWGMAWLRFLGWGGVAAGVIVLIVGLTSRAEARPEEYIPGFIVLAISALLLAIAYLIKPLRRASYDRAVALAKLASLNEAGLEQLRQIYGQGPSIARKSAPVSKSPQAL